MGMMLTPFQGLHSLSQLAVDHRDVSISNVLLSTEPDKVAGFISNLDLSSISEEAIKVAYPNDYDTIIKQMKSFLGGCELSLQRIDGMCMCLALGVELT